MAWDTHPNTSRERSILVALAKLQKAGKLSWLTPPERKVLVEHLDSPLSKRLAQALLAKSEQLSVRDKHDLRYVKELAALK